MVQLGDRVKDKITGFEGIVVGITEWLYQCRRPIVQPTGLTPEGKTIDAQSFDEDQLEVLEAGAFTPRAQTIDLTNEPVAEAVAAPVAEAVKTGGPRDTPSRQATPTRR